MVLARVLCGSGEENGLAVVRMGRWWGNADRAGSRGGVWGGKGGARTVFTLWVYNRSRVVGFSKPTEILSGPGSWVGLPPGFPLRASEPAPDMKNLVRRAASANEELSPGVPADNCPTDPGHERFACVSVAASRGGVFTVPPDAEVEGFSKPTQKKRTRLHGRWAQRCRNAGPQCGPGGTGSLRPQRDLGRRPLVGDSRCVR